MRLFTTQSPQNQTPSVEKETHSANASEPTLRYCKNCYTQLHGEYCSECGQRDFDFKKNWKVLAGETLSSLFNFDGKIPRGLFNLIFRPGYITKEFLAGRRAKQIPPVRLYLFSNLVFFLFMIGVFLPQDTDFVSISDDFEVDQSVEDPSLLDRFLQKSLDEPDKFVGTFQTWLPKISLFIVPLLALATRILFRKRNLIFLEHIIIALYFSSFFLIWGMVSEFTGMFVDYARTGYGQKISELLEYWVFIYLVLMLKNVFSLGWLKAMAAAILLTFYAIFMGVALIVTTLFLAGYLA